MRLFLLKIFKISGRPPKKYVKLPTEMKIKFNGTRSIVRKKLLKN